VSSLTVPHSDYKPLIRIQALRLRWNSETEYKLHSIEPRVYVINMLRLPRRDKIIIHRLRIGHTYLTHGHLLRGVTALGAWLVKWIWLLYMSCFIVFPFSKCSWWFFSVLLWPPCLNCFRKSPHVQYAILLKKLDFIVTLNARFFTWISIGFTKFLYRLHIVSVYPLYQHLHCLFALNLSFSNYFLRTRLFKIVFNISLMFYFNYF